MARVKAPTWDQKLRLEKEHGIPMNYLSWNTKRAYIRINGVFTAIGWLLEYGPMEMAAERKWYFLPD